MAVAVILGGASPARAELLCGGTLLTPYVYPGAVGAESRCEVIPGYEVSAGGGVFAYGGSNGVSGGAGICYPASVPGGVACVAAGGLGSVSSSGWVFAIAAVQLYPDCGETYLAGWIVPVTAGGWISECYTGLSRSIP